MLHNNISSTEYSGLLFPPSEADFRDSKISTRQPQTRTSSSAMMGAHHYSAVADSDDVKEEFKDEPQQIFVPVKTAWWKLLLGNLLAAAVGAALMYLFTSGYSVKSVTQTSDKAAADKEAAIVPVSTVTTTATTTAVSTSIISAAFHIKTTSPQNADSKEVTKQNPLKGKILDCGYSPEEARAQGCVYDVMMQDWVPEPCYDSVLTEKYLAQGNWTWYADGEGKTTMTDEQMRKGEHGEAWMSTSYHKAHCVFSWLKIIRALRNNEGISEELLSYDHVLHCSHGALKANIDPDHEDLGVKAPTNYARCALYEDWKLDFVPDKHDSTSKRWIIN